MNLTNLSDALGNNPGMVLAVILGLAGMLTLVIVALGTHAIVQWRIYVESERMMEFTRELIAHGFSPAEIEKIVRTSEPNAARRSSQSRHSLTSRSAMARALRGR